MEQFLNLFENARETANIEPFKLMSYQMCWIPSLEELEKMTITFSVVTQSPGNLVIVGSGCPHFVLRPVRITSTLCFNCLQEGAQAISANWLDKGILGEHIVEKMWQPIWQEVVLLCHFF
jgi:hypothetical protein